MNINKLLGIIIYYFGDILIKIDFLDFKANFIKIKELKESVSFDYKIPKEFFDYIIIAEDKRFYSHYGFDILGIIRAIIHNLFKKKFEGASTIDQQFIRTITNMREKKLSRKLKEIILATQLKKSYSKNEIIYYYLMIAYFGTETIGLEAVIRKYNKDIYELDKYEISEIISRLKYPESSKQYMYKIKVRSKYILHKLKNNNCRSKGKII